MLSLSSINRALCMDTIGVTGKQYLHPSIYGRVAVQDPEGHRGNFLLFLLFTYFFLSFFFLFRAVLKHEHLTDCLCCYHGDPGSF